MTRPSDNGLGITETEIWDTFAPFAERARPARSREWRAVDWRRRRKIVTRLFRKWRAGRLERTGAAVVEEYSEVWDRLDLLNYSMDRPAPRVSPWEWRGEKLFASTFGATRFRQLMLVRLIERLKPRTVLEVGCGNGINLLLLACRFPEIRFHGIELTEAGHEAAVSFQRLDALPEGMQAFAPLPLADVAGFRKVVFQQGSATDLPFEDDAFDLVYTVLAVEQMEQVRDRALSEIARVTGRHYFGIEPFGDVNKALWPRLNVMLRDYFRGRIDQLGRYGLAPVMRFADYPQERFLKTCAVLAEKRG